MKIDRDRLIKLLRMTESNQDAEVLLAIRKSNELLRACEASWSDVIAAPQPKVDQPATRSVEWSRSWHAGYERSDAIRGSIRREFPITLAFFPLWIAAELLAIFYPNIYWNKNARRVTVAVWSLCWLGLLSWLGAGAYLLLMFGD